MSIVFSWDIDLSTFVDHKIEVETHEGIRRVGRLKEVVFGDPIQIEDREVRVPIEIRFDDSDRITLSRIKSIKLYRSR